MNSPTSYPAAEQSAITKESPGQRLKRALSFVDLAQMVAAPNARSVGYWERLDDAGYERLAQAAIAFGREDADWEVRQANVIATGLQRIVAAQDAVIARLQQENAALQQRASV